ncbi:MAG: o-succinylbenzoate--CoA ligase [Candidatus Hydrogenedentota bacterium]
MTLHNGKPSDPAVIAPEGVLTYSELDAQFDLCVTTFRAAGIQPGHRVALYQSTSLRYLISMLALIELGTVACPISTRLPEDGLQDAVRRIGAQAIFYADRVAPVAGSPISPIFFDGMRIDPQEEEAEEAATDSDRWATIIFTSGSSGTPKAAVHSLDNHFQSALASNVNIALVPGDQWLLSLPLFHVGGLGIIFRCLQAGAAMVLPQADESLEKTLETDGVTHISLVSTQLYRLMQSEESTRRLAKFKAVLMGGSAMPERLIARAIEAGIPIHTSYGMTEMTTQITCTPAHADNETLQSSGFPLRPDSIRLADDGEIQVNGPTRFQGYFTNRELDSPFTSGGWFSTGDCGRFDKAGRLHVTGRVDNQFISGGENIQPEEIEHAFCQIEGILQAVVVPINDEEFGQRPVALIRAEGEWNEASLKDNLRQTLPRFMIPARILEWPSELIPEGMKVNRTRLREYCVSEI